jgi:hypothetical protein
VGLTIYGAVGYQVVEGWSLLDALYMTVITLATVGFHEVQPLDAKGQVFTISLISAGVIVVSGPTLSDRTVDCRSSSTTTSKTSGDTSTIASRRPSPSPTDRATASTPTTMATTAGRVR